MMQPRVVDISHHNTVTDLKATAMSGVWGVIHKSSQGSGYRDPDYAARRKQAKAAGLLWGAYHFNDGSDVAKQVDWFIKCAQPDDSTLMVLDFEDNPKSNMSVQQAVQFLRLLEQKTGRKGAIYSGNRLKETVHILNSTDRAYLTSHRLWLCQYGPRAVLPTGFAKYWLWQWTGDGVGMPPHNVPGITARNGGLDLNAYEGDRAQLKSEWAPSVVESYVDAEPVSTHSAQAEEDAGDDASEQTAAPINVQPETTAYSLDIEILQKKLDNLGYHDVGEADGKWGGKTKGALTAFLNDRGSDIVVNGGPTPAINSAISVALSEGWTRPISEQRATATAKDIAPKVEVVRQTLFQRLGAKIAAGFAAVGLTGSSLSSTFETVRDKVEPFREFLKGVPPEVWFLALGVVAGLSWFLTNRALKSAEKDYNTGKIN